MNKAEEESNVAVQLLRTIKGAHAVIDRAHYILNHTELLPDGASRHKLQRDLDRIQEELLTTYRVLGVVTGGKDEEEDAINPSQPL